MKSWLHKIEAVVDKLIPYLLVVLLFLIIGEIFYAEKIEPYRFFVSFVDNMVVVVFVFDLIFKYMRAKHFPEFFRQHWLEIIAVFPAFLFVRIIEEFLPISRIEISQSALHEAMEAKREGKLIAMEVERVGAEASRIRYFARFIRPLARLPRFLRAFSFYEKPAGKHHPYENKKKQPLKRSRV